MKLPAPRASTGIICGIILGAAIAAPAGAAEKKPPVTEPAITGLEQRVESLERQLKNQGLLDMLQQLQSLQAEITRLRGQIEVNTHELEQMKEQQRSMYKDIDRRLQKLEGKTATTPQAEATPPLEVMSPAEPVATAGAEAQSGLTVETVTRPGQAPETPAGEEPVAAGQGQPAAGSDPLEAQAEYQQAFNLLKQAQYDKAITAFDAFLGKYPDSQYSDNAQYWMGEAYYVNRRYNEAITEYMKLLTNYPQSQKAPNSLLKIAYSYYELKQDADARKVLEELIKRYPGTSAAQDAEQRLQR